MAVDHFFGVLRPTNKGVWIIQNDSDHAPQGLSTSVTFLSGSGGRTYNGLFIAFTSGAYVKAGSIQITPDDDFAIAGISAASGLGLTGAGITVLYKGQWIDPTKIYQYAPNLGGGGNFWINGTMVT
jgi:hypothetical protein